MATVLGNKTSQADLSFEAIDEEGNLIAPETNSFHIIGDQISRNVIKGETTDYLMGQNIRREYELKKNISEGFHTAFNQLKNEYKRVYNVTKVGDYLLRVIQEKILRYILLLEKSLIRSRKATLSIEENFLNMCEHLKIGLN